MPGLLNTLVSLVSCKHSAIPFTTSNNHVLQMLLNSFNYHLHSTLYIRSSFLSYEFHTMPLLRELPWLKVLQRIQFCLCLPVYHHLHGSGPKYLAETLHLVSDVDSQRHLSSGSTSTLLIASAHQITLRNRAFPVAAARIWNTLPASIRTSSYYWTFQ